jgi:hypothetical protein
MPRIPLTLLLLCSISTGADAQTTVSAEADTTFARYKANVQAQMTADDRRDASDPLSNPDPFFWALVDEVQRTSVIRLFEDARLSKQLGTSATGSGTTSIAVRGDSPSILSLALEHGVVTGSRTGENVTFRGNLVGLVEAAVGQGFVDGYHDSDEVRWLRRLSFAVSFDPSGNDENAINLDADRMTSWSARLDITNKRDPRDPAFRQEWATLDETRRAQMQAASNEAMTLLFAEPAFQQWRSATLTQVGAAQPADVDALLDARLTEFRKLSLSDATRQAVVRTVTRTVDYLTARRNLVEKVLRTPIVVFEYTKNRPLNEPRTSDYRFIAEGPFFGGKVIGNAALVLFDTTPPGGDDKVKQFDAAVQWDIPLSYGTSAGPVILTLAGRLQRIHDGIVFQDALLPNTKGNIGVFQMKATVPISNAGVRIPISVTWANRSELIREKFVRGQIGLTFDFDALAAAQFSGRP